MAIPKKNKAEEEQSPESRLSERYPDPAVEVLDPSFAKCRIFNAAVERLADGMRWSEGPVWFGGGRYLLWSDLPNNRIMKWEEETGQVIVFRKPSNYANGNTQDRQGRLVTCEHGSRRVTRTEPDRRPEIDIPMREQGTLRSHLANALGQRKG
jgi:gluconolactonase